MNTNEELAPKVTVVVTIGHNGPNGAPMTKEDITDFVFEVDNLVQKVQIDRYSSGTTYGYYGIEPEQGTCWVFTASGHDVRILLRPHLADLAAKYRQEAIGLIVQCDTNTLVNA